MVVGEALEVVVERVVPGGGEHAHLAHAAARALAPHARLGDLVGLAHEHRPDRRAEALRQAHRHRVGDLAVGLQRHTGRDVRVPEPGAVEMDGDPGLVTELAHGLQRLERLHGAAAEVVGVLDGDERRRDEVRPLVGAHERAQLVGVEQAARCIPRARRDARQRGSRAELGAHHVRLRVADQLLPRLHVHAQPELVGERAGGGEQAGVLAEQVGHALLERVDGRVLAVDVVADLGVGHRRAHACGGTGDGVAAQVHESAHGRRA